MMKRACEKGMGVVVMNPLGGGVLGWDSSVIRDFLPGSSLTSAELALKFVLDSPYVTCAISGFSNISNVEENAATARATALTPDEYKVMHEKAAELAAKTRKLCSSCRYCMPCEQGVMIPNILTMRSYGELYGLWDWARKSYNEMKPENRADKCTRCGQCEEKCANKIAVADELARAHEKLKEF
jgi:predicted aldo/keto reductase-like oxidoreductase